VVIDIASCWLAGFVYGNCANILNKEEEECMAEAPSAVAI
jgi:hypothetical protein